MFREMRLKNNALAKEEAIEILKTNTNGVLAVYGDDDYPYTVPLSFVYHNHKIIFHCANTGHKLDGIKRSDKVSFCVIDQDNIIPEEFNTLYRSVIAFGKAKIITDLIQKTEDLRLILKKYSPGFLESGEAYIEKHLEQCTLVEISIDYLTGKAGN